LYARFNDGPVLDLQPVTSKHYRAIALDCMNQS